MMKVVGAILITVVFLAFSNTQILAKGKPGPTPTPTPTPTTTPIVCIDPGHGGTDSGATMTGLNGTITEEHENLLVAKDLEALLSTAQIKWVATRTSDIQTLSNADRYNFCNSQGAALELSIHMNGSTNTALDYTEVLYGKKTKDYAWATTLDSAMGRLENATNAGLIQNNGITSYADGVLLKSNMPAALAETVFITSTNEYNLLTDGTGNRQNAIAQQLATGVESWIATH